MSISFSPIGPWYAGRRGGPGRDGPDGLGLRPAAPGHDGPLALGGAGPAAGGRPALPAGGAPAVGHAPGEEEAGGLAGLPARRLDEHEDQRRGARPDPLGHGAEDRWPRRGSVAEKLGPNLEVKTYRFDCHAARAAARPGAEPDGRETDLGAAMVEAVRRQAGKRIAALIVLSDGANNTGIPPLVAARQLQGQQVPVVTVGFGSENAGAGSKDIAVRDLAAGPTVFVKNQLQVRGDARRPRLRQPADRRRAVRRGRAQAGGHRRRSRSPRGPRSSRSPGLKYIPQTPGEKKVTLRVKPKEGELVRANNEISTFITVLAGGLNVLYLQGPTPTWEYKYLFRSIMASPDIQAELKVVRRPAGETAEIDDDEFAPGRYDVYILGDLPADYLTRDPAASSWPPPSRRGRG